MSWEDNPIISISLDMPPEAGSTAQEDWRLLVMEASRGAEEEVLPIVIGRSWKIKNDSSEVKYLRKMYFVRDG